MKIRDLNINDYVIVYDLGKSEYSEGMTVVGKVKELEYKDIDENEATIESVPFNEYTITDDNYFDLWSNSIEDKTESIGEVGFRNLNVGDWIQYVEKNGQERFGKVSNLIGLQAEKSVDNDTRIELELLNGGTDSIKQNSSEWIKVRPNEQHLLEKDYRERFVQSNDVQQRKRNLGFENVKIPNSNKTVRWKDNGNLEVQSNYELDIPDYILQDEKPDVIGYLNKQIKCKENNDFIEEIIKNYNPIVAYYVGKSIDNLRENEIDSARDLLNKAFKHWE
ncbi:hypothetical protein [Staphylococcus nepalensis]|uniref:hypothetical protein n=1 Tax=Staphylococcus nepalensis TaxID=214473 RepID=UPI003EE56004